MENKAMENEAMENEAMENKAMENEAMENKAMENKATEKKQLEVKFEIHNPEIKTIERKIINPSFISENDSSIENRIPVLSTSVSNLPKPIIQLLNFSTFNQKFIKLCKTSLYEIIKNNSTTKFLLNSSKTCYSMNYSKMTLEIFESPDIFKDQLVKKQYMKDCVKSHMHSMCGENEYIYLYSFSEDDWRSFLLNNSNEKYVFAPITIHSIESANGLRHDMLLIFSNLDKKMYLFDCKNRMDYLSYTRLPKNAMDIFFVYLSDQLKLGYTYEPTQSWEIQGILKPFGNFEELNFIMSTAWCYNFMLCLPFYNSPTEYLSVIDGLSEIDRFNLIYRSLINLSEKNYKMFIPVFSCMNLCDYNIDKKYYEEIENMEREMDNISIQNKNSRIISNLKKINKKIKNDIKKISNNYDNDNDDNDGDNESENDGENDGDNDDDDNESESDSDDDETKEKYSTRHILGCNLL